MEPPRLTRSPTTSHLSFSFDLDLLFADQIDDLARGLNQSNFCHFVETFKGLRSLTPPCRVTAGYQLLDVLSKYFKAASPHLTALDLDPSETRGIVLDLTKTFLIVSDGQIQDKKSVLDVIARMVLAFPKYHDAFYNCLGRELMVDKQWYNAGFSLIFGQFSDLPAPKEEFFSQFFAKVADLAYLFWPERDHFMFSYATYHLQQDPAAISEVVDFLLAQTLKSALPRKARGCLPGFRDGFNLSV